MDRIISLFKGRPKVLRLLSSELLRNPQRMILLSFLLVITIGTTLLMLPAATISEEPLGFVDALFTSTSATCVTGLVVSNVATTFTTFGQSVILIMIQLGGLGIMTISTFFMAFFIGRVSVSGREVLVDTFSQTPMLELGKLIMVIFTFTVILEFSGWLLLSVTFFQDYPLDQALFFGLFHSISSFCNAGFTIIESGYIDYASNWYFNIINMMLIVAGGLGFIVIFDFNAQLRHFPKGFFKRLSLHSKIVLNTSAFLILAGAALFLMLEFTNTLEGIDLDKKVLISLFQSTTTRTAGFNTISIENLAQPTLFMILIFMFIGASPGSCGGGIKTTTFLLFVHYLRQQFSNNKDINIFYKRIPVDTLSRAVAIVFFAIFTIGLFTFLLLLTETYFSQPDDYLTLTDIVFEVISAFGTVGLSTGITAILSDPGKVLITLLMFIGRLGPLTLVFALKSKSQSKLRYMKEDILVG